VYWFSGMIASDHANFAADITSSLQTANVSVNHEFLGWLKRTNCFKVHDSVTRDPVKIVVTFRNFHKLCSRQLFVCFVERRLQMRTSIFLLICFIYLATDPVKITFNPG